MTDISPKIFERIAALEAQVEHLYRQLNIAPPPFAPVRPTGIPPEIVDLVRAGRKIDAIKLHREMFGSDLSEAKNIIDSI